jgi:hypothetical protein
VHQRRDPEQVKMPGIFLCARRARDYDHDTHVVENFSQCRTGGEHDFQSAKVGMRTEGRVHCAVDEKAGRRCLGRGKRGAMSCRQAPATSTQRIRRRNLGLLDKASMPSRSWIMFFRPSRWMDKVLKSRLIACLLLVRDEFVLREFEYFGIPFSLLTL